MTLLSDAGLRAAVAAGELAVDPWTPELVQPSSVDVRLGPEFCTMDPHALPVIDPAEPQDRLYRWHHLTDGETFLLQPGEFVLAATAERITVGPALAARLEGKSSLGRLGLVVHATAGFIDPGFTGQVTLELGNAAPLPIVLRPGMAIGQLCVMRLDAPAAAPYGTARNGSRYQGQTGPQPSRAWVGWKTWPAAAWPAPAVFATTPRDTCECGWRNSAAAAAGLGNHYARCPENPGNRCEANPACLRRPGHTGKCDVALFAEAAAEE